MAEYCNNCKQTVLAKRKIGFGTILMILITWGFWILFIPLYSKRCTICGDMNFGKEG